MASERREHEFADASFGHGRRAAGLDDFGEIRLLDQPQHAGALGVFESHRADFRHAVVIHHARPIPARADPLAHRGHAAAGLAGDDDRADLGGAEIDAFLARHVEQTQCVGGRAAEHFGAVLDHRSQACRAAQPATRQAQAAVLRRSFKRRPETEERPERKREINARARLDSGGGVDALPVAEHPLPALVRVEDRQRATGRAAGLAEARVGGAGKGEIRSVGRMRGLVGDQLQLVGEGHARGEIREVAQIAEVAQSARDEAVAWQDFREQRA